VVEHQMQLHGSLGPLVLRPVIHRQIQVNDGRIKTDQFILEPDFFLPTALLETVSNRA
jgi:hypothetical protein